ncbi:MAG: lysophospholipid acyltransferase family protein [Planctomycetales bacterium]|nr:lysophospholipid acyltransferase family protein [Planctomycetales bacterium]
MSAILFAGVLRMLFRTLRLDIRADPHANPYAATGTSRQIFAVWHDCMVIAAFGGKHARTVALTSQHRDGTFVAGVLSAIGVPTVRGSTGARGGTALRQIITCAANHDIVITPDGPRGPSRKMSQGIIYLASRSARAIVPTAFSCETCWRIHGSWCDLIIPKPFSRVYLLAGEPMLVPPTVARAELHEYAAALQVQMELLDTEARRLVATDA